MATTLALPNAAATSGHGLTSNLSSASSTDFSSQGSGDREVNQRRKEGKRANEALATTTASNSPNGGRRNSKSKNKRACNKITGNDASAEAEAEQEEEGIHLATAVAVTVTSAGEHLDVEELLNLVRERGLTGGSTYEMGDSDGSGRGSGYFVANGTAMSLASSSNGSSCANSTNGSGSGSLLSVSQSSTTSLPVLNLQHLQHYVSNTSYLNNHHSHHLPHLPLPLIKNGSSSSTTSSPSASLYGSSRGINSFFTSTASSPPPHLLSFLLEPSGSISPTSSCSSTTSFTLSSFTSMGGASSPLSSARMDQSPHPSDLAQYGMSEPTAKATSPSASAINKGEPSQGVRSVGEVLTLEELKRREIELSEVLSEEEWHDSESLKRLHLLRGEPVPSGQARTPESERRDKEREKELKRREKEREKELKRNNKANSKSARKDTTMSKKSYKKAESENEGRESKRDRDRTTPATAGQTGRKRANSSKSRKSEDKDKDSTSSRVFLSSSSSAVECRQTTSTKSQRNAAAAKEERKARKKEEKEREKERARREREKEKERERRERRDNGQAHTADHAPTPELKRKRPKYSLGFSFRNKSLSSSSLPKMKTAKGTTIIPKNSPLALMPATAASPCETSSSSSSPPPAPAGSSPSFLFAAAAANSSTTSLSSSLSYSATSSAASSGRKKSSLSSGNSGTKRPFIFSYNSNGSSPNGSSIGEAPSNGDFIVYEGLTSSDSDSDCHETEVEKDMETVASRFFRRRGRTTEKKGGIERSRSRDGSPKFDSKPATTAAPKKNEKQTKKGKKENKDQIRQSKDDLSRRRQRSSSRRIQYSGSEDSESQEDKTEYSLTRTKSCRSQLSSSGGSCSSRVAQLLSDSGNNVETDKIDRLAKTEAVNEILKIELARLHEEKQKLELERLLWESQQKMATQLITPNKQIKLNIGGEVFFTSIETLRRYPNCTLCLIFTSHYFCSLPPEQQDKGYFIDRDAKHFRLILNFLRTGAMVWPESAGDRKELMLECEFYNLLEYVSLLPRKEFCRSASKLFGSPLECDQDYRKITFHFDSSFLFLLSISFTPYFPDEAPILHVQSLSHCDEESKPIELVYSHFLAVGTSKMDTLAERVHGFVISQLDYIKRCLVDKYVGHMSESDEFDSLTSEDSRRPSTASTEQFCP